MTSRHASSDSKIRAAIDFVEATGREVLITSAPRLTEGLRGRAGFEYAVHDRDADVLLAVEGERIVGLASVYADILSIRYGPRCWLQDLVVTASHRSRGIGAQLMGSASDWARERGCTHLELSSGAGRNDAHRFYLSQGMSQSYNFGKQVE